MREAKDLYGSEYGSVGFVIGSGPSLEYAKKMLSVPHKHVFTIAVNRAITEVPADYWLWIDQVAYERWGEHPNAKAAKKCGVEKFKDAYRDDVYLWERVIGDTQKGLEAGNLVHRNTSLIAAISLAFRLGAVRIVTVGCENFMTPEEAARYSAEDRDYMISTFCRVSEALENRKHWLHPKVMLADASKIGIEWGQLRLPKTTIGEELDKIEAFWKWKAEKEGEKRKKKLWLPSHS